MQSGRLYPFFIVWAGQLISTIGSGITAFALGIYVYKLTGSATHYSLLILAALLPSVLLKPIGGAISDRMDRRLLMLISDLGSALSVLFIIWMLFYGISSLWPIYLGAILSSIFNAFHNPAYKASVTDLVDETFYAKASGLMQLVESSKMLISPVIAGVLIHMLSIQHVLLIDVGTFIVAAGSLFLVKKMVAHHPQTQDTHWISDLISGFRYTVRHKGILYLLCITSLITFFLGFFQALWGPMILSIGTAQQFGISQTVATSGMLVSSALIGVFSQFKKKVSILVTGTVLGGLFFALMGVSAKLWVITGFGFLFFLALPFINTSLDVLVRTNVSNDMQGRIWSIVSLISQSGMLIALAIAGFIADNVVNPLFEEHGLLASSVGQLIGIGPGRGIGFLFFLAGIGIMVTGLIIGKINAIRALESATR